MKNFCCLSLIFCIPIALCAQPSFKAGWLTCKTGTLTHIYSYTYSPQDSIRLVLADSAQTYVSADSMVVMDVAYQLADRSVLKTIYYLNPQKSVAKKETYRDEVMQEVTEWTYDKKNRKTAQVSLNKLSGLTVKKLYEYSVDKKTGETEVRETAYNDGRVEFYTHILYDKNDRKIKETRLNDNNKDVVHIETYFYGENGKLKERSVYFPEWKVTRKFEEKGGDETPRCYHSAPLPASEKPGIAGRMAFIRRTIQKNKNLLNDKECSSFEITFNYPGWCALTIATTGFNNQRRASISFREKY